MTEVAPTREQVHAWAEETQLSHFACYVIQGFFPRLQRFAALAFAAGQSAEPEHIKFLRRWMIDAAKESGTASRPVPTTTTERDVPREILLYAETATPTFEGLRAHLVRAGVDYLAWAPVWETRKVGPLSMADAMRLWRCASDWRQAAKPAAAATGADVLTEEECSDFQRAVRLGEPANNVLQSAARIGAERARERAARVCEGLGTQFGEHPEWAATCAAAIRRGEGS